MYADVASTPELATAIPTNGGLATEMLSYIVRSWQERTMNGILLLALVKAHYTGSHDWEDAIDVSYPFSSKRFDFRPPSSQQKIELL